VVLVVAVVAGVVRLEAFGEGSPLGVYANMFWVGFDILVLWVVVRAVRYRGPDADADPAPAADSQAAAVATATTRGGPPA
jgi:cellulose synthase (UDP-forming)